MSRREVELTGGSPWGFRMHGGADVNQPLRISRVNPGRKASLGGIREGDVISSINGHTTRAMSVSDAHTMLCNAGPVLRLGLNEDRQPSPRRRSIGKGPELKRPSQLLDEGQKAIPQAPVYATIRPSNHLNYSSSMKSSINPSTTEEEPKFHHTNPFYTTLPTSSSKLPVPNGKPTFSTLDRTSIQNFTETKDTKYFEETITETNSLPYKGNNLNGIDKPDTKSTAKDTSFTQETKSDNQNQRLPELNNPFGKFKEFTINHENISNGKHDNETVEKHLDTKEEIIERSTITEEKISEIEEIKTIKKFILNGSDSYYDERDKHLELRSKSYEPTTDTGYSFHEPKTYTCYGSQKPKTDAESGSNESKTGTGYSSNEPKAYTSYGSQHHEPKTDTGYSSLQRQYREYNSHSPRITECFRKLDSTVNNYKVTDSKSSIDSYYAENNYNYESDYKALSSHNDDNTIGMDFNGKNYGKHDLEHDFRKTDILYAGSQKDKPLLQDQKEQKGSNLHTFVGKHETEMERGKQNSGGAEGPTITLLESSKAVTSSPGGASPAQAPIRTDPNHCNTGGAEGPTITLLESSKAVTSSPGGASPAQAPIRTDPNHCNTAVWRPGAPTPPPGRTQSPGPPAQSPGPQSQSRGPLAGPAPPPPPPPPAWASGSAGPSPQAHRKPFRPVHFEETPPARRKFGSGEHNGLASVSDTESRMRTSHSAPITGLHSLSSPASRLPRAQNPTVTLLQKAREGQFPRGSSYLPTEQDRLPRDRPAPPKGDPVHALRKEYASDGEAVDFQRGVRKMANAPRQVVDGIGPITKDGMPVALRSEVKDQHKWYKKMYDTIHKNKRDDDQPTQRYKNKTQCAYFDPRSGYLSEPEGGSRVGSAWSDAYDSDVTSGPRRRTASVQEDRRNDDINSTYLPSNKYSTLASARASHEVYKNQPRRIEDYVPGKSSVLDKEAKQWWDEVMDIFDGWLDDNSPLPPYSTLLARAIEKTNNLSSTTSLPQSSPRDRKDITSNILSKSNMARALKESGYESDSTLIFRRRDDTEAPLSPAERRAAYRDLQAGGEPPLKGFRSPAPARQDESEIEYIPLTPTLTKIRVHKKSPKVHEVYCYPVTDVEQRKFKKQIPSFISVNVHNPPAPPRRVSSRNSRTLRLVTNTRPASSSPKRIVKNQSNVDFLRDKISHKLTRQNTHIISKRPASVPDPKSSKTRVASTSAPPALNRKTSNVKICNRIMNAKPGTSSFASPRRTLLPTEYNSGKYCGPQNSVTIEGGAGRRTPITNILDKVTTLDKLWSSEKRNERIDLAKARTKSAIRGNGSNANGKTSSAKPSSPTHKSRDMTRTSEKVQKLKVSNVHTKPHPFVSSNTKNVKPVAVQSLSNSSKSFTNATSVIKKQSQIKSATVTNLKKKKSLESVTIRPRSVPCHESCTNKSKQCSNKNGKKVTKSKNGKTSPTKFVNGTDSESQFGDMSNDTSFGSFENFGKQTISAEDIERTRNAVLSDSFFRHLFFGNSNFSSYSLPVVDVEPNTTVLQKAKMFQSYPQDVVTSKSINSYLIHRKPVSLSRFTLWDRCVSPTGAQSPRSISWPGRSNYVAKKWDSTKSDEFGSTSSLATVRSKSEPREAKLYFSQTSRPKSPTVVFFKKVPAVAREELSPTRLYFSESSRPVSPRVLRKIEKPVIANRSKSQSPARIVFSETVRPVSPVVTKRELLNQDMIEYFIEDDSKHSSTLYFSQTSRPVSPKIHKKCDEMRTRSTSPATVRSPSYRRISSRFQSGKHSGDPVTRLILRTRSASDADKKQLDEKMTKTKSESSLKDPDYDEYIEDMQNNKTRSERFRELNRYYTYLERVSELEKTTSTCDLRHRRKDEEIIDFDRWKKIRAIERAEEELNNLYNKLKTAQIENDVLFYPRDVKDFKWNYERDRGLKIKERSVEDLRDHFQQLNQYDCQESDSIRSDTYKPLWRGTSVSEAAFVINRKNENRERNFLPTLKPLIVHNDSTLNDLRKKIGIGNRLWSSLSMEQVKALKTQLNAIYSRELESKLNKVNEKYVVDVKEDAIALQTPFLHVRSNSLSSSPPLSKENELVKSESISAISCPVTSVKELKNNVNKISMSLTESEKRKISQTISREVLKRVNKFENPVVLPLKEEIEQIQSEKTENEELKKSHHDVETVAKAESDELIDSGYGKDENYRHVIFPAEQPDIPNQSSASETETASSDISNRTVIFRQLQREVQKKVEYFESVKNSTNLAGTIYHARESSDDKSNPEHPKSVVNTTIPERTMEPSLNLVHTQSQSCTNIKELFGECEKNKFMSLPSKPKVRSRSVSPQSEVCVTRRITPDTLAYSSEETVWRSRSPSPDPERYWRAYLNLAKAGEVRRLARRFDSPSAAGAVLRRHRSDPEIHRNGCLKPKNVPVPKIPLRPTNRYMPHIDVISKLASLRRRTTARSRSAEEVPECRTGEVDRIRRRFEAMSILGHMYASAPDVSDLRDISHLSGPWIAHRYPMRSDNNRSAKDPASFISERSSPVRRDDKVKRVIEPVKLSSILKSDVFGKQEFDPSAHRPKSRYEPARAPARPPPASWPRLAPYILPKHSVKFQETDGPEPPRRMQLGSHSDTESPRRYVESDVNIHYRVPVRRDPLPLVPERELARQQADHMKRLYREQKRNKYLQEHDIHPHDIEAFDASIKELQDMQNRRHQDNFTPAQKNILPLNRYDEADKVVARAVYTFNGQTNRELSFRKGDVIHVRRQIDANWYEGELHGKVGLFPYNYVEILKGDSKASPKKPTTIEGRARAKYDFVAQTNLELPLKKGELVVLTRRIDHNWWEGRNGTKTGIFPDNYVTVLQEPSHNKPEPQPTASANKPMASPAAHGLVNGAAARSMGPHAYTPQLNSPALSNAPQRTHPLPDYHAKPASATLITTPSDRGYGGVTTGRDLNNTEPLYVDTNAEAVPYRAMYKYRPQNPDELELNEGDTVYVLEQCDDGWYVGSSQRTGRFGTFPGNYVERI